MRNFVAPVILLLATGCAGGADIKANEPLLARDFPDVPADAIAVVERLAICTHLAGEVGDNDPERARYITRTVRKYRCRRVEEDASAIRTKYAGNRRVEEALEAAESF